MQAETSGSGDNYHPFLIAINANPIKQKIPKTTLTRLFDKSLIEESSLLPSQIFQKLIFSFFELVLFIIEKYEYLIMAPIKPKV